MEAPPTGIYKDAPLTIFTVSGPALLAHMGAVRGYARHRPIAWINLSLCFPALTGVERQRMLRKHFESLGMSAVETALCWWAPKQQLRPLAKPVFS